MRFKSLVIAVVLCLAAGTASADPGYKGPGWYVEAYDIVMGIWSGPYSSEAACEADKPADDDYHAYVCEYFDQDPD